MRDRRSPHALPVDLPPEAGLDERWSGNFDYLAGHCDRLLQEGVAQVGFVLVRVDGAQEKEQSEASDELLMQAAQIFNKCVRRNDVIARLGYHDFGLLLPRANDRVAQRVCDRLLKTAETLTREGGPVIRFLFGIASGPLAAPGFPHLFRMATAAVGSG